MIKSMTNPMLAGAALTAMVLSFLTTATPVWAQDAQSTTRTTIEESGPTQLSDLGMHFNPQLGLSSFEYSDSNSSHQKFTGGGTFEFGEGVNRAETGLLLMQAGGKVAVGNQGLVQDVNSSYLAIPMMAKIRVMQMPAQSWYIKAGALTAFEVSSNHNGATNNLDILASLGLSGRFLFTKSADFIVEATYNRGLIEALRSNTSGNDFNQGVLALVGLSIRI